MKDPLALAATAPNEAVGGLWKGILEDNGINCFLKSDNLRAAQYAFLLNQSQQVWVLKSNLKEARALLKPLASELADYPSYGKPIVQTQRRALLVLVLALALSISSGLGLLGSTAVLWSRFNLSKKSKIRKPGKPRASKS